MKSISILAEQVSDRALAAVLPPTGIASVTLGDAGRRNSDAVDDVRGFRNPARFSPRVRIDLVVDDHVVETVFDALSFAYGAGVFSDAEAWVNPAVPARAA